MAPLDSTGAPRLTEPPGRWLFNDPVAGLWLRPWFDRAALHALTRWYMPLSRAWAAALVAGEDAERFWRELPGEAATWPGPGVALRLVARRRRRYEDAAAAWERALFGNDGAESEARVAAETRRRGAAERLMLSRSAFVPLALQGRLPPVKWEVRGPQEVAARHGPRVAAAEARFPPPDWPEIARSQALPGPAGEQFWLRFPSPFPETGGEAWARVFEPAGVAHPPTIIFLHGICVELEFWPDSRDPLPTLAGRGIRVVRPEGPWHGRRRLEGSFGGEPALARGPIGFIELFEAWVAEIAVLIAWARHTSDGPVALGGISLGALTSQLVATAARHWPERMRPDALLLVATSGEMAESLSQSSMGRAIGLGQELAKRGWRTEDMAKWRPLVEPEGAPAPAPERIVMVLGSVDDVTPYPGGMGLSEAWQVPAVNRFVWPRDHFSTGLGIAADQGPIRRLIEILEGLRGGRDGT